MIWHEVDLDAATLVIPTHRLKAGSEHRIPLSKEAVDLLNGMERLAGSQYVFLASRGGQLSDMALSATMRRMHKARNGGYVDARSGRPAVPHGIGSTLRDWAAEKG